MYQLQEGVYVSQRPQAMETSRWDVWRKLPWLLDGKLDAENYSCKEGIRATRINAVRRLRRRQRVLRERFRSWLFVPRLLPDQVLQNDERDS